MRTLILGALIVGAQWVVINRYPDPRVILATLTVPALVAALGIGRLFRLRLSVVTATRTRRGGGHR